MHQFNLDGYDILYKTVGRGNKSSTRINLPLDWLDKDVAIILLDELPKIKERDFQNYMQQAETFKSVMTEHTDFWTGYQRGLRRLHHGNDFGTEAEHETWYKITEDENDVIRRQRGQGYRAGYAGKNPIGLSKQLE